MGSRRTNAVRKKKRLRHRKTRQRQREAAREGSANKVEQGGARR